MLPGEDDTPVGMEEGGQGLGDLVSPAPHDAQARRGGVAHEEVAHPRGEVGHSPHAGVHGDPGLEAIALVEVVEQLAAAHVAHLLVLRPIGAVQSPTTLRSRSRRGVELLLHLGEEPVVDVLHGVEVGLGNDVLELAVGPLRVVGVGEEFGAVLEQVGPLHLAAHQLEAVAVQFEILVGRPVGPDEVGVQVVVEAGLGDLLGDGRPAVRQPPLENQRAQPLACHVSAQGQTVVAAADDDPVKGSVRHLVLRSPGRIAEYWCHLY